MAQPSRNSPAGLLRDAGGLSAPTPQMTVRAAQSLSLLWLRGRPALHLHNADGTDGSMLPHGDRQLGSIPPAATITGRTPWGRT